MKKIIVYSILVLVFTIFIILSLVSCNKLAPLDKTVYMAEYGEVYHNYQCSYIYNHGNIKSDTIKNFESRGYRPCSRCKPNYVKSDYSNEVNQSTKESKPPSAFAGAIWDAYLILMIIANVIIIVRTIYKSKTIRNEEGKLKYPGYSWGDALGNSQFGFFAIVFSIACILSYELNNKIEAAIIIASLISLVLTCFSYRVLKDV